MTPTNTKILRIKPPRYLILQCCLHSIGAQKHPVRVTLPQQEASVRKPPVFGDPVRDRLLLLVSCDGCVFGSLVSLNHVSAVFQHAKSQSFGYR